MALLFFTDTSGKVNVVIPAPKEHLERLFGPMTEQDYMDHVQSRSIPKDAVVVGFVEPGQLPDNYFRDAWVYKDGIEIDMEAARDVHMGRIRRARNRRLKELDQSRFGPEYDEERQRLRDIPQTFDLSRAKNAGELKTFWPENLERK